MTVPGWLTVSVVQLAAVGGLAFLLVGQCNRARSLAQEAREANARTDRVAEAGRLDVAKVQRAKEATQEALQREIEDQIRAKGYLSDALVQALKAAPKAKPVATATGSTGPVAAVGGTGVSPSPCPARPTDPVVASSPATGSGAVCPPCLLVAGDKGEVRVAGAVLRTEAGNVVLAASAEAWRLDPEARLFGGPVQFDASYLKPPAPPREAGWGWGAAMVGGRHGWSAGPVVAAPPLRLWRLQVDASAGVTLGGSGEWAGVAQAVGRWR